MNGVQFLLLAFCLTLVEVINTLLVGYADMVVFCEFSCLCHICLFYNLSLAYLFSGFCFTSGINTL